MPKVILTGANGRLGSAIVEQLLQISPASLLAVSVRDPKAAERWTDLGLDVRHGDLFFYSWQIEGGNWNVSDEQGIFKASLKLPAKACFQAAWCSWLRRISIYSAA